MGVYIQPQMIQVPLCSFYHQILPEISTKNKHNRHKFGVVGRRGGFGPKYLKKIYQKTIVENVIMMIQNMDGNTEPLVGGKKKGYLSRVAFVFKIAVVLAAFGITNYYSLSIARQATNEKEILKRQLENSTNLVDTCQSLQRTLIHRTVELRKTAQECNDYLNTCTYQLKNLNDNGQVTAKLTAEVADQLKAKTASESR